MNTPLRMISQISLFLAVSSLFLFGCAQRRVYYPKEPTGHQHEYIPEREQPSQEYERKKTPGQEQMAPPQREEEFGGMKPSRGPAHTLYRDAEHAMRKGDYKQAEMLLNRALRIEPRNGWYWHAMGQVKYAQTAYEQAIQFCLKSDSLAGSDPELKRSNHLLMQKAYAKTHSSGH